MFLCLFCTHFCFPITLTTTIDTSSKNFPDRTMIIFRYFTKTIKTFFHILIVHYLSGTSSQHFLLLYQGWVPYLWYIHKAIAAFPSVVFMSQPWVMATPFHFEEICHAPESVVPSLFLCETMLPSSLNCCAVPGAPVPLSQSAIRSSIGGASGISAGCGVWAKQVATNKETK